MGYKESPESRSYIERLRELGKEQCLVPYTYDPPLQKVMDTLSVMLIILAVAAGIYFQSFTYFLFPFAASVVIFSIRELFVQDDRTLIRIYGPLGRIRSSSSVGVQKAEKKILISGRISQFKLIIKLLAHLHKTKKLKNVPPLNFPLL